MTPEQIQAIRRRHEAYGDGWMPEDGYSLPGGLELSAFGVIEELLAHIDGESNENGRQSHETAQNVQKADPEAQSEAIAAGRDPALRISGPNERIRG